jgi:hypothetical protein
VCSVCARARLKAASCINRITRLRLTLLLLDQILVNARAAVPLLTYAEGGVHEHLQSAIVTGMRRSRTTPPVVEAARADSDSRKYWCGSGDSAE